MRIKCPRCGLKNKPDVAVCQSCGDDLSEYYDDVDAAVEAEETEADPLDVDILRKKRRNGKSEKKRIPLETGELPLDWKDELNRRVKEIKAEREGKPRQKQPAKKSPTRKGRQEDEDDFSVAQKNVKDLVEELEPDYEQVELYDDDHHEEYDMDEDEEDVERDEPDVDDLDEDEPEEYDDEIADEEEYIPSDPDEIKQYIARKVQKRKKKRGERVKTPAEEYGYRKYKRTIDEPEPRKKSPVSKQEETDLADRYTDSPLYQPVSDDIEEPAVPGVFHEETRNLLNMKRIYAAVWDNIILGIVAFVIFKLGAGATKVTLSELISVAWFKLFVFYVVVSAIYNLYFTVSNGQTIGKMLMQIRLISEHGGQVHPRKVILHYLITLVSVAAATVGYFWFFFNSAGKNLADLAVGTRIEFYND